MTLPIVSTSRSWTLIKANVLILCGGFHLDFLPISTLYSMIHFLLDRWHCSASSVYLRSIAHPEYLAKIGLRLYLSVTQPCPGNTPGPPAVYAEVQARIAASQFSRWGIRRSGTLGICYRCRLCEDGMLVEKCIMAIGGGTS
ncbi:hypothetical protein M413DRAFT_368852 [Hebeloma cylindrosporum]|uniref:Uncharacterized protein n=1 Tax=Hebeloma cylindrosporum TaxID=76867 RepID=A0A0C2Y259_HEBCY|nr:hypothetical protein M413DRAFT_368852 [Hebeloma cylindrosporum h7]